jgi:hypothetical protein
MTPMVFMTICQHAGLEFDYSDSRGGRTAMVRRASSSMSKQVELKQVRFGIFLYSLISIASVLARKIASNFI